MGEANGWEGKINEAQRREGGWARARNPIRKTKTKTNEQSEASDKAHDHGQGPTCREAKHKDEFSAALLITIFLFSDEILGSPRLANQKEPLR